MTDDTLCDVTVGPKFRQRPRNAIAKTNSDHEFVCDVYANPPPTIYWLKNGVNVTTTDYIRAINSRTLRILGLLPSDAGMYQCIAVTTESGCLQAAAQLAIEDSGMCSFFRENMLQ